MEERRTFIADVLSTFLGVALALGVVAGAVAYFLPSWLENLKEDLMPSADEGLAGGMGLMTDMLGGGDGAGLFGGMMGGMDAGEATDGGGTPFGGVDGLDDEDDDWRVDFDDVRGEGGEDED